jgi:hypothetical protein
MTALTHSTCAQYDSADDAFTAYSRDPLATLLRDVCMLACTG